MDDVIDIPEDPFVTPNSIQEEIDVEKSKHAGGRPKNVVWNYFKNLKTVGVVSDSGSVVEIASPRGVVAAIIPSTNPTSTAIFKLCSGGADA